MRILMVSMADRGGGAERIALRLTVGLQNAGHEAVLAVGFKHLAYPWVHPLSRDRNQPARNRDAPPPAGPDDRKWSLRAGVEDFFYPGSWDLLEAMDGWPDLVHLHNLHTGYFDLRVLPWLSAQVPVVMTLHDCWLLSGHCAHPLGCERWRGGCGACPDLSIYPPLLRDNTANNWARKREILASSRFSLIGPCDWLRKRAEDSLPKSSLHVTATVPNGINTSVFRPADQAAARARLGLPKDAAIALYVANGGLANPWRDPESLCQAIMAAAITLAPRRLILLVVGGTAEGGGFTPPQDIEIWQCAFTDDASQLLDAYHAADLLVHPAWADSFPTVVLEAMACGLPVVATAVDGIPEQVIAGETGLLVPPGEGLKLAQAILTVLQNDAMRSRMSVAGRRRALEHFDERVMIDRYLALYADILASSGGSA
ncbi:glycosyltransferase family 4 protein [Azospirillum doebereinerae]|uniref:Glycosyltransferase n=1 Tax=Azospirillum doebereinerae TaxID=92933 RepID=A0A3S0V5N2_9PROT|nr:glycosyltransferase family 4 protein [Azospirillum doebereinerae]RUQ68892.1 glycosyltransferase [Azospirillum doebereinerae]